jgi:hypothetical protein
VREGKQAPDRLKEKERKRERELNKVKVHFQMLASFDKLPPVTR